MTQRAPACLKGYRQFRAAGYTVVRRMGDAAPWIELGLGLLTASPTGTSQGLRKVIRRAIYKRIGTWFGATVFSGRGGVGKLIREVLGL